MAIPLSPLDSNLGAPLTAIGRMQPAVPLLQPSAAGLRGNLCKYTPKRSALILLLPPQGGYRKYVASKLAVFYVQTPSLIRPHITAELTYPRKRIAQECPLRSALAADNPRFEAWERQKGKRPDP